MELKSYQTPPLTTGMVRDETSAGGYIREQSQDRETISGEIKKERSPDNSSRRAVTWRSWKKSEFAKVQLP
jgi:hypothetical protein